jgi:acyl-CoA thioester hydrolase
VDEKRLEIRWRDLDPFGHVNQSVYQTYLEEIIDSWLRATLGLGEGEVWQYVTARVAIDYRSELRQTDVHAVGVCSLVRVGNRSVTLRVEIRAQDGRLAAEAETVIVARERISDADRTALSAGS